MKLKYARPEFERKFLLGQMPPDLPSAYRLIEDRYLENTTLRLRRITDPEGRVLSLKLNQKRRDEFGTLWITSLYLSEAEYRMMETLPTATLRKRRYTLITGTRPVAIDVIPLPARELCLAEIEGSSNEEIADDSAIPTYLREVTREREFEGYQLALFKPHDKPQAHL